MVEAYDEYFAKLFDLILDNLEDARGGPFGAGILSHGKLIATGVNSVLATRDVSRHAEINALAAAGAACNRFDFPDTVMFSTHFPCLMCYHALRWARIPCVYYAFDYQETAELFGIHGDLLLLRDLGLTLAALKASPGLQLVRYESPRIEELYRGRLVSLWNDSYREKCGVYDIA